MLEFFDGLNCIKQSRIFLRLFGSILQYWCVIVCTLCNKLYFLYICNRIFFITFICKTLWISSFINLAGGFNFIHFCLTFYLSRTKKALINFPNAQFNFFIFLFIFIYIFFISLWNKPIRWIDFPIASTHSQIELSTNWNTIIFSFLNDHLYTKLYANLLTNQFMIGFLSG